MRVLHAATHLAPLSGAPSGACLRYLVEAQGRREVDVAVVVPAPENLEPGRFGLARRIDPLPVPTPTGPTEVAIFEGQLPSGRARLFAVEGAGLDDELFGRAALAIADAYDLGPDVVHAHDNRALRALAVASDQGIAARIATVRHPRDLDLAGLDAAARIVAPGPSCAAALRNAEFAGAETADFFGRNADRLRGISDGVEDLDPRYVAALPSHYWVDNMAGKAACKDKLQQQLSLPRRPAAPLIGFAPAAPGDLGLVASCGAALADLGAQVVFAVDPVWSGASELSALAGAHPLSLAVLETPTAETTGISHRVFGGADFALLPSEYDWAAPNPLACLRFGTMPIVRYGTGLSDQVVDFDAETGSGNAIAILNPSAEGILAAVRRAVAAHDQPTFPSAVERALRADLSWRTAAHRYFEVYGELRDR